MADSVTRGLIPLGTVHPYSELPKATEAWIREHFFSIPQNARPDWDDLPQFAQFFTTYLINSFDLIASPGMQRFSPGAHCFCPICSWMIAAPNLQARKVTGKHKSYADRLMVDAIAQLAIEQQVTLEETDIAAWIEQPPQREPAALVAYGRDLFLRMQGVAEGPAILALWRRFAWTPQGSPKPNFRLTVKVILQAEQQLATAILAMKG
ncbi:hypothetical protein LOC68_09070 [Blastopirellula sp. JC732]|uniref:Uncharacterized protein n=1 Tax=Blastopirellula sediminis TaxID=2894196 RepID=A0A9X1ML16_9BACT|nr:hypothetical protein [Blastopirellula sediminis]MCC9608677.1 hypothetical protein [Blastopirellula sediminis]MCC9628546.1 hypothetical protein [Blastopirellula sediminis]